MVLAGMGGMKKSSVHHEVVRSPFACPGVHDATCHFQPALYCNDSAASVDDLTVADARQWLLFVSIHLHCRTTYLTIKNVPLVKISHLEAFEPRSCGIRSLS